MKPIVISCIPLLAFAAFQCSATEQVMAVPRQAGAAANADPAAAVKAVEQALRSTRDASADGVAVSSHASTIILTGKVDTQVEADHIRATAEGAAEGLRVSSQIEVDADKDQAEQQMSSQLTRGVENALRQDRATATLRVLIASGDHQGIVLSGLVPTRQARLDAARVAAHVPGVKSVDNRLTVPGE